MNRHVMHRRVACRCAVYRRAVYRHVTCRCVAYRLAMYRHIVYRRVVYRHIVYRCMVYRCITYRCIKTCRCVMYGVSCVGVLCIGVQDFMESVLCAALSLEPSSPEHTEQRWGQDAGWASSIRERWTESGEGSKAPASSFCREP